MQIKRAAVLAIIALSGCSIGPKGRADLFTLSEYTMTYHDRLLKEVQAPLIVLGVVVNVRVTGKPRPSPGDPRITTQETVISIKVENVIKGHVSQGHLDIIFYKYSVSNKRELGRRTYDPETGQRQVFFLRREGEAYRTVGDVTHYTLPVRSTSTGSNRCIGKTTGCCIADLLLAPPTITETAGFLRDLPQATYAAAVLCSPQEAREKLEALARHDPGRIGGDAEDMVRMLGLWFP